ncbi:MAG: hypothetical protein AAFR96_05580 [Planctomycetota bacterium]
MHRVLIRTLGYGMLVVASGSGAAQSDCTQQEHRDQIPCATCRAGAVIVGVNPAKITEDIGEVQKRRRLVLHNHAPRTGPCDIETPCLSPPPEYPASWEFKVGEQWKVGGEGNVSGEIGTSIGWKLLGKLDAKISAGVTFYGELSGDETTTTSLGANLFADKCDDQISKKWRVSKRIRGSMSVEPETVTWKFSDPNTGHEYLYTTKCGDADTASGRIEDFASYPSKFQRNPCCTGHDPDTGAPCCGCVKAK